MCIRVFSHWLHEICFQDLPFTWVNIDFSFHYNFLFHIWNFQRSYWYSTVKNIWIHWFHIHICIFSIIFIQCIFISRRPFQKILCFEFVRIFTAIDNAIDNKPIRGYILYRYCTFIVYYDFSIHICNQI